MMSDIINLVRYDKYYRKIGNWPVVPLENIREQYTRSTGIIDGGILINAIPYNHRNVHFVNNPVASLENDYKDIKYLVTNYSVIAAGGAVYKAIYNMDQSTDIDIYFISPRDSEEETLIEIMRYFENKYKDVLFVRNHRCTSIIIQIQDDIQIIYQFIHRTYATKDSVVGGFDISVASAYYDGQIYTTPLGSFCIANRLIVVDHAKYATSYLSRLCKYRDYNTSLLFINYVSCQGTFDVKHNDKDAFSLGYHKASDSYRTFTVSTTGARDYDIDMNHIESLGTASKNGVLAMYNQLDMICWTGKNVDNVLVPIIQYTIASRYGGPPPRISAKIIAMLHEVSTGYIEDLRSKVYGLNQVPEYVDEWNRLINGCADKADKIISERIDQARLAAKNGPKWYKCTKYHRAFNHVKISAREFYGKRYIDLQFYIPEL